MTLFEIVLSLIDAGLAVGVFFIWRDTRKIWHRKLEAERRLHKHTQTTRPQAQVELYFDGRFIGLRPEGHPDLNEPGVQVVRPQEKP